MLRHAKSSWEYPVEDRNRPLTTKGMQRIVAVSEQSQKRFANCDVVFSSPANRALHTATLMMHTAGIPFEKLAVREDLYTFEVSKIIAFVRAIGNNFDSVICVGHNPAFTMACQMLGNSSCEHLPTAAWGHLVFKENDWQKIQMGTLKMGLPKTILKQRDL